MKFAVILDARVVANRHAFIGELADSVHGEGLRPYRETVASALRQESCGDACNALRTSNCRTRDKASFIVRLA